MAGRNAGWPNNVIMGYIIEAAQFPWAASYLFQQDYQIENRSI
jgi:hypothetical protein